MRNEAKINLVSVIIPYYNGSEYLEETILSIVNQSYKNIEIIVVDDASPYPAEVLKLKELKKEYKFTLLTHEYNTGIPRAFVTGVKAAQGNYVAFTGQDDLFLEEKIQKQVSMFEENPEMVANYTGKIEFYSDDPTKEDTQFNIRRHEIKQRIKSGTILEALYKVNSLGLTLQGLMVKKDIVEKDIFCIWNKLLSDDWPVHIRLFELYPDRIGFVDEPLAKYRLHSKNMHSNELRMFTFCCDTVVNAIPAEHQAEALATQLRIFGYRKDNSANWKKFRRNIIQIKLTKQVKLIRLFGKTLLNIDSRSKTY